MKTATVRTFGILLTMICLVTALAPAPLRAADQSAVVIEPPASIELPPSTMDQQPFPAETEATLDRLLRQAVAEAGVPGAIAGVWLERTGGWVQAVGLADLATGEPMRPEMAVRIASITKSFTAVTLLQLVDQGKLGLDDPLSRFLDFVPGGEQITLRMLLNHTSGLFDCDNDPSFMDSLLADPLHRWTPRQMVDLALAHPPDFAPGQGYGYSNTNYLLLGMVIEKVSGEPYETQVQKQVLQPLALRNTSFPTGPDLPAPFAHGFIDETVFGGGGERQKEFTRMDMGWDGAAGALVSTLADLKIFARALAYGRLVSLETYKQQTAWHLPFPGNDRYGVGLGLENLNGLLGHNGADPGYAGSMFCDPFRGLTVIVFYNLFPAKAEPQALVLQLAQALVPGLEFPDPSQPGLAWWMWLLIGVGSMALLALLVGPALVRKRQ